MGKTFKDSSDDATRDRKRNRNDWRAERKAARTAKVAIDRGEYVGKRKLNRVRAT